ncbi:hypothetical protein BHM03_00014047 [Ensete ventricosum]|nr:hypothetical protein BHM03_00014047 [Ensete ventricosum]
MGEKPKVEDDGSTHRKPLRLLSLSPPLDRSLRSVFSAVVVVFTEGLFFRERPSSEYLIGPPRAESHMTEGGHEK